MPKSAGRARLEADAMRVAGTVPWAVWRPCAMAAASGLGLRPNRAVRQWQRNVEALTGRPPSRSETRDAVVSWARNVICSMSLGRLTADEAVSMIVMDPEQEHRLRAVAASRGVVLALPHMGSWDLAGAWACGVGMPVSTVAEQLHAPEFELFLRLRQRLGFTVYGHSDPTVTEKLIADSRAGMLVCLLADRNFGRGGVRVTWSAAQSIQSPTPIESPTPLESRVPAGPAHVALRSGAMLMGLAATFEGDRLRLTLSEQIEPDPKLVRDDSARGQLVVRQQMMQAVVDFFAEQIRARPSEWHMLQPIFPGVVAR